jgi:hypothetical protein
VRSIGSLAGSGYSLASARSAYGMSTGRPRGASSSNVLAERAPGGVARGQLARHAASSTALDGVPHSGFAANAALTESQDPPIPNFAAVVPASYHGETGDVADVGKETVAQVSSVNAYKQYMQVFRADDEIQSSLVKIRA